MDDIPENKTAEIKEAVTTRLKIAALNPSGGGMQSSSTSWSDMATSSASSSSTPRSSQLYERLAAAQFQGEEKDLAKKHGYNYRRSIFHVGGEQQKLKFWLLPQTPTIDKCKGLIPSCISKAAREGGGGGMGNELHKRPDSKRPMSRGNEIAQEDYLSVRSGFYVQIQALLHKPEIVVERVLENLHQTERAAICLMKLLSAEKSHAGVMTDATGTERNLREALRNEKKDVGSSSESDSSKNNNKNNNNNNVQAAASSWNLLLKHYDEISKAERELAECFEKFLVQFVERVRDARESLFKCLKSIKLREKQWRDTKDTVIKKRMECFVAYASLKEATTLLNASEASFDDIEIDYSKGGLKGLMNDIKGSIVHADGKRTFDKIQPKLIRIKPRKGVKIKGLEKILRKVERPLQKTMEAFQDYVQQLEKGNQMYVACWEMAHGLPATIRAVGMHECCRYEAFRKLLDYIAMFKAHSRPPKWLEASEAPLRAMHEAYKLSSWLESKMQQHGGAKLPTKFIYNLPCTIEDLVMLQWSSGSSQYSNPIFTSTKLYRPKRDGEARVNKGDLVFVEAKLTQRPNFWKCQIETGPFRCQAGLLPMEILRPTKVHSGMKLIQVLRIQAGYNAFSAHCAAEMSSENLDFWKAVEQYQTMSQVKHREIRARNIMETFIWEDSPLQININAKHRHEIEAFFKENKLNNDLFDKAQKEVYDLMRKDSYARFKDSDTFKSFIQSFQTYGRHL